MILIVVKVFIALNYLVLMKVNGKMVKLMASVSLMINSATNYLVILRMIRDLEKEPINMQMVTNMKEIFKIKSNLDMGVMRAKMVLFIKDSSKTINLKEKVNKFMLMAAGIKDIGRMI